MSTSKKILVVDDEPDAVVLVEFMLTESGFSVISANDGMSGVETAKEALPDLVILDVNMPGKDGFWAFSELKNDDATKDIPVIMLTGVREKSGIGFSAKDMKKFIGKEPNAYIEKPVDKDMLQKTVCDVLGL